MPKNIKIYKKRESYNSFFVATDATSAVAFFGRVGNVQYPSKYARRMAMISLAMVNDVVTMSNLVTINFEPSTSRQFTGTYQTNKQKNHWLKK